MGHKYSIRSDAISRVNGVRAIVLEPHERVLNITYRNSLSEHSIVHIHGINPEACPSRPRLCVPPIPPITLTVLPR